jgi:hypothetical protein
VQYEEPIVDNEKSNKPNDEVCQIKNIFQSILSFKIDFKKYILQPYYKEMVLTTSTTEKDNNELNIPV